MGQLVITNYEIAQQRNLSTSKSEKLQNVEERDVETNLNIQFSSPLVDFLANFPTFNLVWLLPRNGEDEQVEKLVSIELEHLKFWSGTRYRVRNRPSEG